MHIQRRTFQLCLALCGALTLLTGAWWFLPANPQSSPNQGIGLRAPAFMNVAQAAGDEATAAADFLEEEAGISAYMNTGSEIDLTKMTRFFRNISKQTEDYIVGSVTPLSYENLTEFEEGMDVQVYIHKEGWIVAYLFADQPASMIFDWPVYKTSGLNSTTLETLVRRIASGSSGDVYHYDFRNPDATNLMLIADIEQGDRERDGFTLEIPFTFIVSDASWSYAVYGGYSTASSFSINGEELAKLGSGNSVYWAMRVSQIELALGTTHQISIYHDKYATDSASYGGIALIYQEGQ